MIKILFFIPGLSEGGAEKVLLNLVNNMDQSKFDITVQTIDEYDSQKYLIAGIRYKAINRCKTKLGRKMFYYWFRLCAELKLAYSFFVKEDYDIEVAYLETVATKIIAQSTNKKSTKLAWVHCALSRRDEMRNSASRVKKQYKKFDKVICVSDDVRVGFQELYGTDIKTKILYNIIDEKEILEKAKKPIEMNKTDNEIQLLAVGRLAQQKNFSYLINTCGKLRDEGYQFHLNILGDGPERENLDNRIKKLDLQNVVELRGFINNPYPWINESDIIVCSSKYEGLSTVVQEAFILGKAIVTTPCTGMQELLGDSEYGLIVDDSQDGLYLGLKSILENQQMLEYYSEMAKKRSEKFAKDKIIRETETFLLNELERK